MSSFEVPTFVTARLILKPLSLNDVPAYEKQFIDYDVIAPLSSGVPWPYPEDGVRQFIADFILPAQGTQRWDWGLFLQANPDELIGAVAFWKPGTPENRGFWLGKKFWGQGLMVEATTALMDYAFDKIGFEKLTFSNALGNINSRRVKEKMGATFVELRSAKFVDPKYSQSEVWELRKEDWRKFSHQK